MIRPRPVTFCDGTRWYEVEGRLVPSVTTVLKGSALNDYLDKVQGIAYFRTRGTVTGEAVRTMSERGLSRRDYMRSRFPDPETKEERRLYRDVDERLEGFDHFREDLSFQWITWERSVFSSRLGVAGSFDVLARIGTVPAIVDVKAGMGQHRYAALQTWAYAIALMEMEPKWSPLARYSLHLSPTALRGYRLYHHGSWASDEAAFMKELARFRAQQGERDDEETGTFPNR